MQLKCHISDFDQTVGELQLEKMRENTIVLSLNPKKLPQMVSTQLCY